METARHREQMEVLIGSLQAHWAERDNYYVGGNMFLHYDPSNRRKFRGPDFFLVMNVEKHRERKSWVVWQEGMRFPDVIIELLSDTTRETDKRGKKMLYEQVFRTAEYYLYDPISQELTGYHLRCARYEEVQRDAQGQVYSPVTGLCLTIDNDWLRWATREGKLLPTPMELALQERQRADQEQQRADQERQRAAQAEQLLAEYQKRFGKLE
jgi:Uma2 family endonuclease